MKNILKKQKETLKVTVEAKTEAQAMKQLFQEVKKQAYEKAKGYLITMHVDEVEVQTIEEKIEVKKFLYFFLPKEVKSVQVQAQVKITIASIEYGLQVG